MKKKRKLVLPILCMCALMCALGVSFAFASADAEPEWSGDTVEASYAFGTELTVPQRSLGGASASHVLTFPDGSATYAPSVILNQGGKYALTYTAKAGGKVYSEAHTFSVENALYSVSDAASSVTYGALQGVRTAQNGLRVALASGDTLSFNKAIPVSAFDGTENFIEGFVYPQSAGAAAFEKLTFTLTDMENPEVYLAITVTGRATVDDTFGQAFVLAGGNGQDMVGLQVPYGKTEVQKIYTNEYGQTVELPFRGKCSAWHGLSKFTYDVYPDDYPFRLNLNTSTMEVWYGTNQMNYFGAEENFTLSPDKDDVAVANAHYDRIVTDLDNPSYYKTVWNGFKSGYVKLTVKADKYSAALAEFAVTKVAGMDIAETSFEITTPPSVKIADARETMPEAKVGLWYPLGKAEAFDMYSGDTEVQTNVWYNYNGDNKISVKVKDGKFYPDLPGWYAIEYAATNAAGVTGKEIVWVHASENVPAITVDVPANVDAWQVGEYYKYPEIAYAGGSGESTDFTFRIFAEHSSGERVETVGGFRPEKTGKWEIVCEVTDFIGQKAEESYELTVQPSDVPVLAEPIVLPAYFVSGGKFVLPEAYGYRYTEGDAIKQLCSVTVTDGNGEKTYTSGSEFTPAVAANGDGVTVVYTCGDATLYTDTVPCVTPYEGGLLDYGKYFVSQDATGERTKNGYVLTTSANEDTLSFTYANPLVAESFEATLRFAMETSDFDTLTVTLADYADRENAIEAVFRTVDGRVAFTVGEQEYKTAYAFGKSNFELSLSYAGGNFTCGGTTFAVRATAAGKAFTGFASDKAYVSVRATGAQEGSALTVISLRGYKFVTQAVDMVSPYIVRYADFTDGTYGEQYVIKAISTGDMIVPSVKASVKVIAPDGSVVMDANGVALDGADPFVDHTVQITQFGRYRVVYTVREDHNFEGVRPYDTVLTFGFEVPDTVAPVIEFTSGYTAKVQLGGTAILPDMKITDNVTAADKLIVYVQLINPNGMIKSLPVDCNAVTLTQKGVYTVRITALDEAGNLAVSTIKVTVE